MILPLLTGTQPRHVRVSRDTSAGAGDGGPVFRPSAGLASAASAGVAGAGPVTSVPLSEAPSLPVWTAPVAGPVFPGDRPILERFAADLRTAPEIVGELTALYIEQHRHLAMRFMSCALRQRRDAAAEILAAARRRAACGLDGLALLMIGALELVTAPHQVEAAVPPAIADVVDYGEALGDDLPLLEYLAPLREKIVLSADDILYGDIAASGEDGTDAPFAAMLEGPLRPLWDILPTPLPT